MAAQYAGYTSDIIVQRVAGHTNEIFKSIITLDPYGPLFDNGDGKGRCQGNKPASSNQSISIVSNPDGYGTRVTTLARTTLLSSPSNNYCQPGTNCINQGCNDYAAYRIFELLANNTKLLARKQSNLANRHNVTIYGAPVEPAGIFVLEPADNPPMQ